jgi:hypothetical protein
MEGNVDAVATLAEAAGVDIGEASAQAAANANKINHIFNNVGHNLDPLVKACGQSKGRALQLMKSTAEQAAKGLPDGVVKRMPLVVNGMKLQVGGIVTNGQFLRRSGFIP